LSEETPADLKVNMSGALSGVTDHQYFY